MLQCSLGFQYDQTIFASPTSFRSPPPSGGLCPEPPRTLGLTELKSFQVPQSLSSASSTPSVGLRVLTLSLCLRTRGEEEMNPTVNSVSQKREAEILFSTLTYPHLLWVICIACWQWMAKRKRELGFAMKCVRQRGKRVTYFSFQFLKMVIRRTHTSQA